MYFINKYRKDMPLPKRVLEDFLFKLRFVFLYFRNDFKHKTILVYPHFPSKRSTIHKITRYLGYNRTNNPKLKHELILHYEMQTFRKVNHFPFQTEKRIHIINHSCDDISKENVEKVHQQAFGYGIAVDPLTFKGTAVKKNNINALHDGEVIRCPIDHKDSGYIYQKLIDNQTEKGLVKDIRITVINYNPALCQIKLKPVSARFSLQTSRSYLMSIDETFNDEEKQKIKMFCANLGLEFGSLDVLRDRNEGRIYIVDANNTPHGPNKLSKKELRRAVKMLAGVFEKEYLGQP